MGTTIIIEIPAVIMVAAAALAFLLSYLARSRRKSHAPSQDSEAPVEQRSVWETLRFMAGPLPFSIALHVLVLLALLWSVHIEQARNLIIVKFQAGGGGGGTQQLKQLNVPEMPMPEMKALMPIERPVVAQHSTAAISEAIHYVRSMAGGGIGIGRGGGIGSGYGRGIGAGFGGFHRRIAAKRPGYGTGDRWHRLDEARYR